MNIWRIYLLGMELVLVVCVVVAAITAGLAAVGPATGLALWTAFTVLIWREFRD
jgi:hypothetical protein